MKRFDQREGVIDIGEPITARGAAGPPGDDSVQLDSIYWDGDSIRWEEEDGRSRIHPPFRSPNHESRTTAFKFHPVVVR